MSRKHSSSNRGNRSAPSGSKGNRTPRPAKADDVRASAPDGTSEPTEPPSRLRGDLSPSETSGEHQGMGRGRRRNFDESDDDATTRGQAAGDETSETPDTDKPRRTRVGDASASRARFPSRGGRSTGHRSDW